LKIASCCEIQVLTLLSQMLVGPVASMFCGHMADPLMLDGAALAISVSDIPFCVQ
jgi:Na+-driven multidrug efflux pump